MIQSPPLIAEPDSTVRHRKSKKGVGVRAWLVLDSLGQEQVVEAGKHVIMRRTGLPARDLRVLDPLLSYPSTVLGREKAIVINLEHIKAIITAKEVLLLNSKDPFVTPFVDELQRRLLRLHHATKTQEDGGNADDIDWRNLYDIGDPQNSNVSPVIDFHGFPSNRKTAKENPEEKQDLKNTDGMKILPFEFIALEACLETACSSLDNEARTLEQEAHPALDKLTTKISTLNLERVRQIKSRLVALTGRVQKVRDEIEHLLDDDGDMAEMYLTEKLSKQNLEDSSVSSMNEQEDVDVDIQLEVDERMMPAISSEIHEASGRYDSNFGGPALTRSSTMRSGMNKQLDVEELEMLLEAYFVQIEGSLNRLTTLREYVDDTEDYINIMLDDKQNHLLKMGVVLSLATLIASACIVVAGIFGMNIHISLFEEEHAGDREFLWTVGGSTVGGVVIYVMSLAWCKYKRLLD